jgi:hypothetical protein
MLRDPNSTWGPRSYHGNPFVLYQMPRQPLLTSVSTPSWNLCNAGREPTFLQTGHANYRNCRGSFTFSNCTMMPAVLEYDITIQGNTITYTSPKIVEGVAGLANDYCTIRSMATSGLLYLIQPYIAANGRLGRWVSSTVHPVEIPMELSFSSFALNYVTITSGRDPCTFTSRDPMDDIIKQLNDMLFRAGLLAGSWANITDLLPDSPFPVHQSVRGTITRQENVFHSDIKWFFGAAAVQILTILLILPAYWGGLSFPIRAVL